MIDIKDSEFIRELENNNIKYKINHSISKEQEIQYDINNIDNQIRQLTKEKIELQSKLRMLQRESYKEGV